MALAPAPPTTGPGADYPVVLGAPFTIDGVTYTPADKLNYDQVGYAVAGTEGGAGVSLAARTLPLPSYVEVTALTTGRTILVRAERRGPMQGDALVELSPGAAAQLGIHPASRTPVRVRRVNPPEFERAALRRGDHAPPRMDTPKSLVAVLMRKLQGGAATLAAAPNLAAVSAPSGGASPAGPHTGTVAAAQPDKAEARPAARQQGSHVVQVGAFASKANAEATATKVGGTLVRAGKLWLVRIGPFEARSDVVAALAKARGAGYSDARIQRDD